MTQAPDKRRGFGMSASCRNARFALRCTLHSECTSPAGRGGSSWCLPSYQRDIAFLTMSGGDLLSHVLRRSTIGAAALNGRVRDGIGCFARARATRPGKRRSALSRGPFGVRDDVVQGCVGRFQFCVPLHTEVLLLPDQIKPIEPLVPVN